MQWPRWYEDTYEPAFADIIDLVQAYEPMHIVVNSTSERNQAQNYLTQQGVPLGNVTFHVHRLNSAWMRDNGPVWVDVMGQRYAQDWGFDGWGGLVGAYQHDDVIPGQVAQITGTPLLDWNGVIHERGNLEFNGVDTVITSFVCFSDRNPHLSKGELTQLLKASFGLSRVVWLNAAPSDDVTGGHVDGIARFIDADTVVVPRYLNQSHTDAWVYEQAARIVARHGFEVLRMDVPGEVIYRGVPMSTNYVNWLVINGAVVMPGFNHSQWDSAARQSVQSYFPGRTIHQVNTLELWYWGGSVHCVTNDQPADLP
jgi:agmatine deiminase